MRVDLEWVFDSVTVDVLYDVRFLDSEGASMFQSDEPISFSGTTYLDDFQFVFTIDELQLYIDAHGPPAAASVTCEEDL